MFGHKAKAPPNFPEGLLPVKMYFFKPELLRQMVF